MFQFKKKVIESFRYTSPRLLKNIQLKVRMSKKNNACMKKFLAISKRNLCIYSHSRQLFFIVQLFF